MSAEELLEKENIYVPKNSDDQESDKETKQSNV